MFQDLLNKVFPAQKAIFRSESKIIFIRKTNLC